MLDSEHYALVNVDSPVPTNNVLELSLNPFQGYKVQLFTGQPPMDKASGKFGGTLWLWMECLEEFSFMRQFY